MKLRKHKEKFLTMFGIWVYAMLMVWLVPDSYYATFVIKTRVKVVGRIIKLHKSSFSDKYYAEVVSEYGYFETEVSQDSYYNLLKREKTYEFTVHFKELINTSYQDRFETMSQYGIWVIVGGFLTLIHGIGFVILIICIICVFIEWFKKL